MRLKLITCRPSLTRFHRDLWVKAENKRAKDVFLKQSFLAELNLVSATNEVSSLTCVGLIRVFCKYGTVL